MERTTVSLPVQRPAHVSDLMCRLGVADAAAPSEVETPKKAFIIVHLCRNPLFLEGTTSNDHHRHPPKKASIIVHRWLRSLTMIVFW